MELLIKIKPQIWQCLPWSKILSQYYHMWLKVVNYRISEKDLTQRNLLKLLKTSQTIDNLDMRLTSRLLTIFLICLTFQICQTCQICRICQVCQICQTFQVCNIYQTCQIYPVCPMVICLTWQIHPIW